MTLPYCTLPTMQTEATAKIDQGTGKAAPQELHAEPKAKRTMTTFQPYIGKMRKPGTGCITQISEQPLGRPLFPRVVGWEEALLQCVRKTREECEALLPGLIEKMKAEIKTIRQNGDLSTIPDGVNKKKKLITTYMCQYPEVTNKSLIAREIGVDKNTVRRHYDEIWKRYTPRKG